MESFDSFDQSLKHLLHQAPEDFIRFGLQSLAAEVKEALPVDLPARGRNVDGSYLLELNGVRLVVHLEFHRRHQSLEELALDVAEAQVRLYRRELERVVSLVWDLYGSRDEPVWEVRMLHYGAPTGQAHSVCVYLRVNLRGMTSQELLSAGFPGLLPLVPLTRDGANVESVRQARAAIEAQPGLGPGQLADQLAVLSFLAEAEGVPVRALRHYISKEDLMTSTLYQEILAEGMAQNMKDTVIRVLTSRLGELEPRVRDQIQALDPGETLKQWYEEALQAVNARAARKLAGKITKATLP